MTPLFIHIGYPKTATSTFQKWVYPAHPDLNYLGKFIPSHRYSDENMFGWIDHVMTSPSHLYKEPAELKILIDKARATDKIATLLSSENFAHPDTQDIDLVAQRLYSLFPDARIIITLREQVSLLQSYFKMHGRYGQYFWLMRDPEPGQLDFPMTIKDWLYYQKHWYGKSIMATLHFYEVWKSYARLFGKKNVGLFLFETLCEDQDQYCHKFSQFLGIDPTQTALLTSGRRLNHSQTKPSLASLPKFPESEEEFPVHEVEWIRQLYREGNIALARETGLDLNRYGYT